MYDNSQITAERPMLIIDHITELSNNLLEARDSLLHLRANMYGAEPEVEKEYEQRPECLEGRLISLARLSEEIASLAGMILSRMGE